MKQLKYAIQNVIRGKGSNIVKVVSITLGLLVSVILIAKVAYELSYDNFYRDNEQLYVVKTGWDGGKPLHGNNIYPTAAAIARHFSAQVESFTTVTEAYGKMSHGNKAYRETVLMVDSAFFQTMGLPLYKGNALDLANPDMIFLSGVGEYVPEHGTVTGILDGFRFIDAAQMEPVEIRWSSGRGNVMHVRLKEPFDDNLKRLNEEMKKLYPQDNVQFTSYAKQMERSFHSERVFQDSIILATIAILAITLMGLVGYINDEIRRRSKEIAIRKINGAEVKGILLMLSTDVIRIAVPAILIGVVLSHYTGMVWKSQFRDVMTTDWLFYTGVFIVVLAFIVGCVIIKSWRIANENPILSLKNE